MGADFIAPCFVPKITAVGEKFTSQNVGGGSGELENPAGS